ncbi:MAG TPA: glycosyltransferase family 2 protein [Candidatus Woesebacteria bacterium]|nr:glycosyltransferase family 2 protein [Candidatus Woesebacteria bacterium]
MNITLAVISKTKELKQLVLDSYKFADEIIVVVDSPTKAPIQNRGVKYYFRPLGADFSAQRNYALDKAQNNWVFFVDDDEYVSSELAREIKNIKNCHQYSGYLIRRIDVCCYQPLLHGETGTTRILRLANKTKGKYVRPVHERWEIVGEMGKLASPLYHIKDNFISEFIGRMTKYCDIDSHILTKENKPFTFWRLFLYPKGKFIQNYFCKRGFLDGTVGLFQSYLMSIQSLTVRVYQWVKRS